MSFSVVFYPGARRLGEAAVYFDNHPCCARLRPISRRDAEDLRKRVLSAGDNAALVGLYVEDFREAIR